MQLGDNWHVNAPWASLVCSTQVPDDIFKTTLELTDQIFDDVNHDSAGAGLAGQSSPEPYSDERPGETNRQQPDAPKNRRSPRQSVHWPSNLPTAPGQ